MNKVREDLLAKEYGTVAWWSTHQNSYGQILGTTRAEYPAKIQK